MLLISLFLLVGVMPAANAQWLNTLRHLDSHNGRVTALVVDLDNMETIASLNPDQRLTPASVSKLFATAAALEQFGPDHRFTTRLATTGKVSGGVLHGNLVLVGGGDPTLDTPHLRTLIERLKGHGVHYITGDIIIDNSLFGPFSCEVHDRCKARDSAKHAYNAPLSSAGINFGTVEVKIFPGKTPGGNSHAILSPLNLAGYQLDSQVKTGARDVRPILSVRRNSSTTDDIIRLRGTLPAGGRHYSIYRAVDNAARQTGRVLATLLQDARVSVEGVTRVQSKPIAGLHTLARIHSDSLGEMIRPMLAFSNNYMADTLTMDVAAARKFATPLTLSRASQTLEKLTHDAMQQTWPGKTRISDGPTFTSGSGLSVTNKVSARDIVALLSHMYHRPALFPSFYGAIPVPISSASTTLKHGNHAWLTRLTAKTGTLTQPVTVRALGGYFRMKNGNFGAFGIIINGTKQRPRLSFRDTVLAYQKDIEAILARY